MSTSATSLWLWNTSRDSDAPLPGQAVPLHYSSFWEFVQISNLNLLCFFKMHICNRIQEWASQLRQQCGEVVVQCTTECDLWNIAFFWTFSSHQRLWECCFPYFKSAVTEHLLCCSKDHFWSWQYCCVFQKLSKMPLYYLNCFFMLEVIFFQAFLTQKYICNPYAARKCYLYDLIIKHA